MVYSCLQRRCCRLDKLTLAYTAATACDSYCLTRLLHVATVSNALTLTLRPLDVYLVEMLYLRFEYAVLSGFHGICIYIYLGVNLVYMYHMEIMYILTAVLLFAVLFFYWSSYYR